MTTNTTDNWLARLEAEFPQEGERIFTGKRGRPRERGLDRVVRQASATLTEGARIVAEERPFLFLNLVENLLPQLSPEEMEEVAGTKDAKYQGGIDAKGYVNQATDQARLTFRDGQDLENKFHKVLVPLAILLAQTYGEPFAVMVQSWSITREHRNGGNGKGLLGRRGKGGAAYVSQHPKEGFLTLGVGLPSGTFLLPNGEVYAAPTTSVVASQVALPVASGPSYLGCSDEACGLCEDLPGTTQDTLETAPSEAQDEAQAAQAPETQEGPLALASGQDEASADEPAETAKERKNRLAREKRAKAKAEREANLVTA